MATACLGRRPAALARRARGGLGVARAGIPPGSAEEVIDLVVAGDRHPVDPPGIRTTRPVDFGSITMMNLSPPRVRVEHAATTVASEARPDDDAVALLADVCQRRRSTPPRLAETLRALASLKRRGTLLEILEDVASGAYSAMERRYLAHVERPHGLPTGARQRRVEPGRTVAYRDVEYLGRRTVVELDGRLGHETAAEHWDDLERDIDAAVAGDLTVRIGWRQVLEPCRPAVAVGRLLRARGWQGDLKPCGPECPIPRPGDPPAPRAGETPKAA